MKNIIAFTIVLIVAFGCENNTKEEVKTTEQTKPAEQQEIPEEKLNDLKFKGTLPCADCEGIDRRTAHGAFRRRAAQGSGRHRDRTPAVAIAILITAPATTAASQQRGR